MVQIFCEGGYLIKYLKITFLGQVCLIISDFFYRCTSLIRNKSPPHKIANFHKLTILEVKNGKERKKL